MKPQMKTPRVAPLEGASTYAPAGAQVSMPVEIITPPETDEAFSIENNAKPNSKSRKPDQKK